MKHTGSHTIIIDSFENIFCKFIQKSENIYECSKCGNTIRMDDEMIESYVIPCRSPLLSDNVPKSIVEFAQNIPDIKENICSEQDIEKRYSICSKCEYFSNNSCSKCGCNIVRDRNYLNKIAIKNEQCPIGLWNAVQD